MVFSILPAPENLVISRLVPKTDLLQIDVQSSLTGGFCTVCGTYSNSVHSSYVRRVFDLPWSGIQVALHLKVRKNFCVMNQVAHGKFFPKRFQNLYQLMLGGQRVLPNPLPKLSLHAEEKGASD